VCVSCCFLFYIFGHKFKPVWLTGGGSRCNGRWAGKRTLKSSSSSAAEQEKWEKAAVACAIFKPTAPNTRTQTHAGA